MCSRVSQEVEGLERQLGTLYMRRQRLLANLQMSPHQKCVTNVARDSLVTEHVFCVRRHQIETQLRFVDGEIRSTQMQLGRYSGAPFPGPGLSPQMSYPESPMQTQPPGLNLVGHGINPPITGSYMQSHISPAESGVTTPSHVAREEDSDQIDGATGKCRITLLLI